MYMYVCLVVQHMHVREDDDTIAIRIIMIGRLGDYTQDDLTSDLHQLSEMEPSFIHSLSQDDIDPLLQVHVHVHV